MVYHYVISYIANSATTFPVRDLISALAKDMPKATIGEVDNVIRVLCLQGLLAREAFNHLKVVRRPATC